VKPFPEIDVAKDFSIRRSRCVKHWVQTFLKRIFFMYHISAANVIVALIAVSPAGVSVGVLKFTLLSTIVH